jgi:4-phytase / acid phosphatase
LSKICGKALPLLLFCVLNCGMFPAQKQKPVEASSRITDRLQMVIILSRHGVRSPTWPQARLNLYSVQPWPEWDVPPGNLTSRGYALMQLFGSFDRASMAANGLLAASGCADVTQTYVWADTDQRTMESGRALAEGLFPGCPPPVRALNAAETDPLFHPASDQKKPKVEAGAAQPDSRQNELLAEMQNVLSGCDPKAACRPAHMPAISLRNGVEPAQGKNGSSDPPEPSELAGSFAEDFLLEYAQGMSMDQVGWGKVDEAQMRRFLELHSQSFERLHRAPATAGLEASNMLFHIVRTLEEQVESKPLSDAIGPVGSKLVVIAGHDTNLAGVAALLGLHWTLDGRVDDTPPGTEMAFELWQDQHGTYSVRLAISMQTLDQLRGLLDLTLANPPARQPLVPRGCNTGRGACTWDHFYKIADQAIDKNHLFPFHSHSTGAGEHDDR